MKNYNYSAFVYERDSHYYADCAVLSMVAGGSSEFEAVESLKKMISNFLNGGKFSVLPIFEQR